MAMTVPKAPRRCRARRPRRRTSPSSTKQAWPGAVRLAALLTQDARVGEDLAQEAFARVFPKWSRVENPNAYLPRRDRQRVPELAVASRHRASEAPARRDRAVSTELAFDVLADAVAALPYRQRAALVLRYYEGLSEAEIADALGCRPGTVKSLTSRALDGLRKGIEQ